MKNCFLLLTTSVWQSAASVSPRKTRSAGPLLPSPRRAQFNDAAATRDGGVPRKRESQAHMEDRVSPCRRSVERRPGSQVCPGSSREARKCGRKSWGVTAAVSQRSVDRMRRSMSWWRRRGQPQPHSVTEISGTLQRGSKMLAEVRGHVTHPQVGGQEVVLGSGAERLCCHRFTFCQFGGD